MSTAKTSSKKRASEYVLTKADSKFRVNDDFDPDLSSDLKELMSALYHIREKAQKDDKKKKEETISSVAAEVKSMMDDLKSKIERDRQSFTKILSKNAGECENYLKKETARFQQLHEKFSKEKVAHMQALKGKKEKNMIFEQEKACADKVSKLEESLRKQKRDDKTFCILRKTLGSFLDHSSEEPFPPDED